MVLSARTVFDPAAVVSAADELEFFGSIRLPSGVFKTTVAHRLDAVNAFVRAAWDAAGFRPSELLDVGASNAVSSVEWADDLRTAGHDVAMVATDLLMDADLVEIAPDHFALVDRHGHVLQHEVRGGALRPWVRRRDWLGVTWLRVVAANRKVAARMWREPFPLRVPFSLVCHAARHHPHVSTMEQDVLLAPDPALVGRFDAVRAANLLNRAYFSEHGLGVALSNLTACLRGPGSHLLVARTWEDGSNHATLFRLGEDGRFAVAGRLGRGSEVEDIVLASGAGIP